MPLGEKRKCFINKKFAYLGWLQYTEIPGKFPGISYFSGNFPGSREAQNPGKMEPLGVSNLVVYLVDCVGSQHGVPVKVCLSVPRGIIFCHAFEVTHQLK